MLKVYVILTLALTSSLALAEDNPAYKGFYLHGNKRVDLKDAAGVSDALMASIRGAEVYKCVTVEAKVNKTGSSIGLRNIKRTK